MVLGTGSHVGKSVFVAALCRWFAGRGVAVAPFKAQNMSLNAAVTPAGEEIGRAQMLQAIAARAVPTAAMNPILLKPEAEARSQVVVMGRAEASRSAREYFAEKDRLWPIVAGALARLRESYDLVIAEGAGSPAEINLRDRDLVNMRVARHADAPVVLLGDIERGGVFASLAGTMLLLDDDERRLVRGFVINKFRGDVTLVEPGPALLEARTGVPTLGVVPFLRGLALPEEDALAPDSWREESTPAVDVAVIALPHLANFDDFDPLRHRRGVRVRFVREASRFGDPDLVVLPGTKATVDDLRWLHRVDLAGRVVGHRRAGRPVFGVCGGFQMLGVALRDPDGVESPVAEAPGLGLLPHETVFRRAKRTRQVTATLCSLEGPFASLGGLVAKGYEIRMGASAGGVGGRPLARIASGDGERSSESYPDGGTDSEGLVLGTYVHGLLHEPSVREALLGAVARLAGRELPPPGPEPNLDAELDRLTEHFAAHVDLDRIASWVGLA